MSEFYIMNASCLFDNKAATIEDTVEQWNDETIIVARREHCKGYSKIFISGSQGDQGVKADDSVYYTQDTGMGHTNIGKNLMIENVIQIVKGKVVKKNNDIGLDEKRRVWVMK